MWATTTVSFNFVFSDPETAWKQGVRGNRTHVPLEHTPRLSLQPNASSEHLITHELIPILWISFAWAKLKLLCHPLTCFQQTFSVELMNCRLQISHHHKYTVNESHVGKWLKTLWKQQWSKIKLLSHSKGSPTRWEMVQSCSFLRIASYERGTSQLGHMLTFPIHHSWKRL